jgi:hypothetical protein
MENILTPPIAFLIYIPLVLLITWVGKQLAGSGKPSVAKSSSYGGGEKASSIAAAPGYRPFFFAILHLGMLVLGSGELNVPQAIYITGLALALIALILG